MEKDEEGDDDDDDEFRKQKRRKKKEKEEKRAEQSRLQNRFFIWKDGIIFFLQPDFFSFLVSF